MPLTPEQIAELLAPKLRTPRATKSPQAQDSLRKRYPLTPQVGPLRVIGESQRCVSRGCGVTTNVTVQGIPYCHVHALYELNAMCVKNGFFGINPPQDVENVVATGEWRPQAPEYDPDSILQILKNKEQDLLDLIRKVGERGEESESVVRGSYL